MRLDQVAQLVQSIIEKDETEMVEIVKNLTKGVRHAVQNGVPGDILEFGTMTGRTAVALGYACNHYFTKYKKNDVRHGLLEQRKLHLFDSFRGCPEATDVIDAENLHVKSGIWTEGTCVGLTAHQLADVLNQNQVGHLAVIHDGWFSETVSSYAQTNKVALVHIDCDLYESTIDAITPLLENGSISVGAQILFDDYDCSRASREHGERRAWSDLAKRHTILYEDLGAYAVSGRRFLIHDYSVESNH